MWNFQMYSEREVRDWIIIKLYRKGYIGHRLLNFEDFGKKIDNKLLLRVLKRLQGEEIVLKKPSLKSGKGRYSLNLRLKSRWEKLVLDDIKKGL